MTQSRRHLFALFGLVLARPPVHRFPGIWFGLGMTSKVATAVVLATKEVGAPPEPRPFTGHLTLARARDRRRGVDLRSLVGTHVAGEWPVTEVCLVESHLSSKGANYEVVETVLLGDSRTMD